MKRILPLIALACALLAPRAARAYQELDLQIPVRSGILIEAYVELPDGAPPAGGWPAVIFIHGYGGSRADNRGTAQAYANRGYIGLAYSTRGFGNSGGQVSVAGPGEIDDLEDIVSYLINNFSIKKVPAGALGGQFGQYLIGTTGQSYGGGHSYLISARDSRIRTIVPVIPWSDLYESLSPGGVPKLVWGTVLFAAGVALSQGQNSVDTTYSWYATTGIAGMETAQWRHDTREVRAAYFQRANIQIPIFAIQGISDTLFPGNESTRMFTAFKNEKPSVPFKLALVNTPSHSPLTRSGTGGVNEAGYWNTQRDRWFDYWLKGIDNGILSEPRVDVVFARAPNFDPNDPEKMARGTTWPLPGTTNTTLYLRRPTAIVEGTLSHTPPTTDEPDETLSHTQANPLDFASDPFLGLALTDVSEGIDLADLVPSNEIPADDVAEFRTGVLTGPVKLVGEPILNAWLASSSESVDLVYRIFDYDPAGMSGLGSRTLVAQGRSGGRRFCGLITNLPTEACPDPGPPATLACAAQNRLVSVRGFTVAHTFPAGHQIQVTISNTELAHFAPNRVPSENLVFHDVCQNLVLGIPPTMTPFSRQSNIVLPILSGTIP